MWNAMAVATTSGVAATISIPRTSRIGRAERFPPCPNPGNGPSGAARNLGKDCVCSRWKLSGKRCYSRQRTDLSPFFPMYSERRPQSRSWKNIVSGQQRTDMPFSTSSTSVTGAAPERSSHTIPGPATASRMAPFRRQCGCTADLKRSIKCQRIGRCPSACSDSTFSPSALTFPSPWLKPKRLRSSAPQSFRNSSGSPPADSASSTTA